MSDPNPPRSSGRALGAVSVALFAALTSGCPGPPPDTSTYVETGDLPRLLEHGALRVLTPPREPETLPRRGYFLDVETMMATRLASRLGVEPVFRVVADRAGMIEQLLDGRGDLVVARLTATEARRKRLAFSVPIDYVKELLVCRADDPTIAHPEDLAGRRVAVRASSSYYETLLDLKRRVPELIIERVPEHMDTEEVLYRVSLGEYEATLSDDDIFEEARAYLDDLRAPFALTGERPVCWAMRPGNRRLKEAVDQFIQEQALTVDLEPVLHGDLDTIRQRQVLRVLTRNSAVSFFLYRGQQMGFDYEFVRRFARSLGCRVQIVIPPSADLLIPWLMEGRGDLIAASMTITADRKRAVAFTRPYNHVSEIVVTRSDDDDLQALENLRGRRVTVRPSSSYHVTLAALEPELGFELADASEDLATENLIAGVASGEYDLTVADSNVLDIELTYRDDVRGAFALGEPKEIAWVLRPSDEKLLAAASDYIGREYRGTFYNVLHMKYFRQSRAVARMVTERPAVQGRISPYDELFREYGRMIEVDWRLLAAQAYEESRFDPSARSWAGALGLMQVLPQTALELGVRGDLYDPEVGIRAGTLYLRRLLDSFEPSLPQGVRLRFALAAYNAGKGHVLDGQRLAREAGLDPNRWFGNVERVLPLLSEPTYASKARFGYCRCSQPVAYVRRVNERYLAYSRVVELASRE